MPAVAIPRKRLDGRLESASRGGFDAFLDESSRPVPAAGRHERGGGAVSAAGSEPARQGEEPECGAHEGTAVISRVAAYAVCWLAFVLMLVDPTPARVALAIIGMAAGLGMRLSTPRTAVNLILSMTAVAILTTLLLTGGSAAEVGRMLAGGVFGAAAMYCCVRAWRG